jgi:CheY-like chemotaxis protein
MDNATIETRNLLLVEDDPAVASLVRDMLEPCYQHIRYDVRHAERLADALQTLHTKRIDVVLLDLTLPDANQLEGIRQIFKVAPEIPIVVLTATVDEALANACIDAGAQDYLTKEELKPILLRRAIGYSITRLRETQLRELRETLSSYRALSSDANFTNVTAAMAGLGPLKTRRPTLYEELTLIYGALLESYLRQLAYKENKPNDLMQRIATRLGDAGAGPRDLLDIHVAALESEMEGVSVERARFFVIEGRLLALEMMGLLVEYFRVGSRRSFGSGDRQ